MAMKIGDVILPDIPEEVKAQYPYLIIVKINMEDSIIYSLFGSTTDMIYISKTTSNKLQDAIVTSEPTSCFYMFQQDEMSSWTSYEKEKASKVITTIGEFTSTVIYTLIWSNHDIYTAISYSDDSSNNISFDSDSMQFTVGTEVYFNKSIKFDGAWYPGIPVEVLETYPYVIIQKITHESGGIGYTLKAANGPYIHIKREIIDSGIDNILLQMAVDEEGTVVIPVEANKTVTYSLSDEYIWGKLIESTTIIPVPIGNAVGESNENLGYYELVWSNHNIYEAAFYSYSKKEYTISNELYYESFSFVKTNDRYYKAIAEKIRNTLKITTQYKPSELPSAIKETKKVVDDFNTIKINSGAFLYGDDKVKIIGDKMYTGLYCGANIDIASVPDNITEIANHGFSYSNISSIVLHDNIKILGDDVFADCINLTEVILPNNITSIGGSCFNGCKNLTSISLPTNLITLKYMAFSHCSSLLSIVIPDGVTTLNSGLFDTCTSLVRVDGNKCSAISDEVFENCGALEILILRNTGKVCTLENTNSFTDTLIESGTGYIYVPSALLENYKTAENWSTYATQFRAIEDYPEICNPTE